MNNLLDNIKKNVFKHGPDELNAYGLVGFLYCIRESMDDDFKQRINKIVHGQEQNEES